MTKPKSSVKGSGHLAPAKKPPKKLVSQHGVKETKPAQPTKNSSPRDS